MPLIKIERIKEHSNRTVKYQIMLDNVTVETIKNDETIDFTVDEGSHTLKIKMGIHTSPEISFTIGADEIKTFRVSVSKNGNLGTSIGYLLFPLIILGKFVFGLSQGFVVMVFIAVFLAFAFAYINSSQYFSLETIE